jgi:hypothetical protein
MSRRIREDVERMLFVMRETSRKIPARALLDLEYAPADL